MVLPKVHQPSPEDCSFPDFFFDIYTPWTGNGFQFEDSRFKTKSWAERKRLKCRHARHSAGDIHLGSTLEACGRRFPVLQLRRDLRICRTNRQFQDVELEKTRKWFGRTKRFSGKTVVVDHAIGETDCAMQVRERVRSSQQKIAHTTRQLEKALNSMSEDIRQIGQEPVRSPDSHIATDNIHYDENGSDIKLETYISMSQRKMKALYVFRAACQDCPLPNASSLDSTQERLRMYPYLAQRQLEVSTAHKPSLMQKRLELINQDKYLKYVFHGYTPIIVVDKEKSFETELSKFERMTEEFTSHLYKIRRCLLVKPMPNQRFLTVSSKRDELVKQDELLLTHRLDYKPLLSIRAAEIFQIKMGAPSSKDRSLNIAQMS